MALMSRGRIVVHDDSISLPYCIYLRNWETGWSEIAYNRETLKLCLSQERPGGAMSCVIGSVAWRVDDSESRESGSV